MARRFPLFLFLAAWFAGSTVATAQRAAPPQAPLLQTGSAAHLTLGQSSFPLNGPWKFTVGDSPIDPKTGHPLWGEPSFDDSNWETVDLTVPGGSSSPINGISGYVPGWTARGHAGYWGWAWYRIRVQLNASVARPGEELALQGPTDFDDVFQVFANGSLLGGFGDFSAKTPVAYYAQPTLFPLPQLVRSPDPAEGNGGSAFTEVISFRMWMAPGTLLANPDVGGLHDPPVLGEAGAVAANYQLRWLDLVRAYFSDVLLALMFAVLGIVALSLVLFDRSDHVYLWMGAVFLLQAIYYGFGALLSWTQHLSIVTGTLLRDSFLFSLVQAGWVMVWWIWFGRHRPAWIPRAVAGLALAFIVSQAIGHEVFFGLVSHTVAAQFEMVSVVVRVFFLMLMLWIVIQSIRRQGLEGWLVLPAVLLQGIAAFQAELRVLHVQVDWGLYTSLGQLAALMMTLTVALLLLRRLLNSLKSQRLQALDIKQAQEVQQVILPEAVVVHPGLAIESEYRPAREVGGDFFQIIPHKADGSLLIVAGDVTGKGLRAGMLVALLVGAIRSTAETNTEPGHVLAALNRRLMGRADAHATCLALRITNNGAATLANAGHIPPYLNGEPLAMEGALPLGMTEGAEFSVMRFQLKDHDKLVLLSDGIVEATDADGNLFGFERVYKLLQRAGSAAQIAQSAQQFGQEDDISVITVTRTAVLEPALA